MLVAHDYMEQTDGGSRLCLELARGLGADLLCGFVRRGHPFRQAAALPRLRTLFPAVLAPLLVPLLRQWILALRFRHAPAGLFRGHKAVIFSGAYAPLAVRRSADAKNVLYCHTPPRFLYDAHAAFAAAVPAPARSLFAALCRWLRPRYEQAVREMDLVAVNSLAVRERVRRFLARDAVVVYPPCDTRRYFWRPSQGYFFSMVRLDHMKRVDLLVRAFRLRPDLRLLVASGGPEAGRLRRESADCPNIVWLGTVSEAERLRLLSGCTATLCVSREEDFGMCAVESLAAGKPVIAAASGGLAEIVTHGQTGLCLGADPDPQAIAESLSAMDEGRAAFMRTACVRRAADFDLQVFLERMRNLLS